MTRMTDAEVLAAIDRGMRRLWAKFPLAAQGPPASEEAVTVQSSIPAKLERSQETASPRPP